jgi:aspartyl-tRNA(Asn)/glutamyl-tRNA(Gln) amidotransferase subunit A
MSAAAAIFNMSLAEAADAVKAGDVTASQLTEVALDRLEKIGSKLNCTITIEREEALRAADQLDKERKRGLLRSPLHGVPLAHKDLFHRAGKVTTYGSPILRDFKSDRTATVLARLDAAGAVNVGSLHLSEFAFSPTGFNKHFGSCRNPWNPEHVTGGSSSGSGAAVAARLVYGALGTDSGGSIRHPAAMCGVIGLKTTQTRVSRAGVMPLSHSLDCVGPMTRTARDCARLLSVIAGHDKDDPTSSDRAIPDYEAELGRSIKGLKIAVPRKYYYDAVSDEVHHLLDESIVTLKDLGAVIQETSTPDIGLVNSLAQLVMSVEAATVHQHWLKTRRNDYADVVRSRIEPGLLVPATRYCEALALRSKIMRSFLQQCMAGADVIHLPAVCIPVPTIRETTEDQPDAMAKRIAALTHCTRGINYLGLPAISVPAGFAKNALPVGFQLVGRPFDEALLLGIADAYQQATAWHRKVPAVAMQH